MDQKPNGPYKHVERPSKSRSIDDEQQDNRGGGPSRWGAVIVILLVIIIALVPIVWHQASTHSQKA